MLLIFVGRSAQILLTMVLMKVATTVLSPPQYGQMTLVTTLASVFSLFFVTPVGMFINRRLHAWETAGRLMYHLRSFFFYLLGMAVLTSGLLALAVLPGWLSFPMDLRWLLPLVCGALIITTINQTYIPALNMLGFRGWFVSLATLTLLLNLGFSLVGTSLLGAHAEVWLAGTLTAQAFAAFVGYLCLRRMTHKAPPDTSVDDEVSALPLRTKVHEVYGFVWPIAIAVGLMWVQSQSYRFLVEARFGVAALGLFAAGYSLSSGIISALESVLMGYFQPILYRRAGSEDPVTQAAAWNDFLSAILPCLVVTVAYIAALAPELARLLLGSQFHDVVRFTIIGAIAESARVLIGAYGLVAHMRMRTRLLLPPHAIGALLTAALGFFLTEHFGLNGTGAALGIGAWAAVAAMHLLMRRTMAIRWPNKRFLSSFFAGGLLIGFVLAVRPLLQGNLPERWTGLVLLGTSGLFYIGFQYLILRPLLPRHEPS